MKNKNLLNLVGREESYESKKQVQAVGVSFASCLRVLGITMLYLLTIGSGNVWGAAATVYTSNVTLSSATKDGNTTSSRATNSTASISSTGYTAVKLGSNGNSGYFFISVPANTTTLTLHAAGWNGKSNKITLSKGSSAASGVSISPSTAQDLTANSGVSGSSTTYTITPNNSKEFFTFTLSGVSAATIIKIYCSERCLVWGVNAETTKTFTLAVPKGDGTYDETQTGQEKTALTEANAIKKRNCGGGDLDGYYASMWTSTAINTPTSTYPSPVYTSSTADGSLPASGTKLYPVFTNDAGKYLTNPSCAAVKTLSSIAITTAPTTTKYLVGETFSKTGAVVTATYTDATTANVSASTSWTPTTGLVAGSNTITASYTEGGVTKTATTTVTAYSVTVQKKDEAGTTIADAGVTASASGRTLTASAGSTHYVFKTWKYGTASGTSIASATSASTSLTGTPSAAVTVIAEFYKPCTVTWSVNGSTYSTTANVTYNTTTSTPANPSVPGECTGSTFMGWTSNSSWASDSAPGDLFNGTSPTITGNITFYAVFADEK